MKCNSRSLGSCVDESRATGTVSSLEPVFPMEVFDIFLTQWNTRNFFLFFYLLMAVLGLRFCARAFSSCGKRGPLFIAVRGPLTIAACVVAEHRLQTRRLSSCGSRAQLLRGMWDLPRPGLEPVSPALAGRLSTTAPPGKPRNVLKAKTGAVSPAQDPILVSRAFPMILSGQAH